jgi:exopolyphosphatase/pppGpp-phosphohydrolase
MSIKNKTKLIIDIGSNSIKFITTKGKAVINKGKIDTGLYSMVSNHSSSKHIIGRLIQLIEDIIKTNSQYSFEELIIYATETIRQFENKEDLAEAIKQKYNVDFKILTSKEETEFSYKVASRKFPDKKDIIVIDLGGASTEISMGLDGKFISGVSLPIGAHNIDNIGSIKINISDLSSIIYKEIQKRKSISSSDNPLCFILMGGMIDCLNLLDSINSEEEHEYILLSNFEHYFTTNKNNLTEYRQKATANGITILDYVLKDLIPDKVYISREDLRFYFI